MIRRVQPAINFTDAHSYSEIGADLEYAQDLVKRNRIEAGVFQQRKFLSIDKGIARGTV